MRSRYHCILTACGTLLLAWNSSVSAQTLVAIPNCGEAGKTKVCVTGSGWAEPSPVCFYRFYFDGVQVVFPDQPDGLFGPPARSFIVPAGAAPGNHTVMVDLRLSSNNALLQTKSVPFKVIVAAKDPWAGSTVAGLALNANFNPTDVCDVTPCKKIVLAQFMSAIGTKPDGTTEPVNWKEWNHPQGDELEANKVNNVTEDGIAGEKDPYINGDDAGKDIGSSGEQSATPKPSIFADTVNYPDSAFKPGFDKLTIDFEVVAFCWTGDNAGEYLGRLTWRWEREKGKAATITIVSRTRNAPSQALLDALNKWGMNTDHPFTPPSAKPLPCP